MPDTAKYYVRLTRTLRFEGHLLNVIWRSRKCFPSRITLAVGVAYWICPWQLIPDNVPILGYSDQLLITLSSLAVARLLIPPRLEYYAARHLGLCGGANGNDGSAWLVIPAAKVRSELLAQWLIIGRRALRLRAHTFGLMRKVYFRWIAALAGSGPGEFIFTLLGYRLWWLLHSPFAPLRSSIEPTIVIGGAARSGTTLLRTILGRHPLIASVPETTVFLRRISSPTTIGERLGWDPAVVQRWQRDSQSQAQFIERVQRAVLQETGKPIWVAPARLGLTPPTTVVPHSIIFSVQNVPCLPVMP